MTSIVESTPPVNKVWTALPAETLRRLANNGVRSAEDWRALSRARRRSFFGITPSMVRTIDAAVTP